MVSKENQIKFYSEELKELEFSVKKQFLSPAISLFQEGILYVGQFKGIDEKRGNVFFDIPCSEGYHSPRVDQNMNCFTLKKGASLPKEWGVKTYTDLLANRNRSNCILVDYIPSKRDGWITMIIREIESSFIENLHHNQLVGFGPTVPPFEYLQNLKDFSSSISSNNNLWNKILNFNTTIDISRQPELITEEIDIADTIISKTKESTIFLLQGPPGTGKTHQIADVISRLANANNSVLVTALTNKAAIELCEKPFLTELIETGKVIKIPLLMQEKNKFPQINNAKEIIPHKGYITLSTYYQFSKIWQSQSQTFDYVIVEEASQAYLTTIAAASKVGKNVIVVGDPNQIVPIVTNKNYKDLPNIDKLINGMGTMCQIVDFNYARKIETRRLTRRSTYYTNCFYQNTIISKALFSSLADDIDKLSFLGKYIHVNGGPTLILFGNPSISLMQSIVNFLIAAINDIIENSKNTIAVLSPFIDSVTYLQQNLKSRTISNKYLIDTVDRVQGLDVDFCFYVIPKSSPFAFNFNRFNVATSRAKKATIILTEKDFDKISVPDGEVSIYIRNLQQEFSFDVDL